ncbi:MAG: hypothetical protein WBC44_13125 [Planctomycetaceae bacterium]
MPPTMSDQTLYYWSDRPQRVVDRSAGQNHGSRGLTRMESA